MKSNRLMLLELDQTIIAQPDGAMEPLLSRSLTNLVGVIRERLPDLLKSAPPDVQSYQLLITVNAIGEQIGLESLTSVKQLGDSSPMNPSPQDSSQLELAASLLTGVYLPDGLDFDASWQHNYRPSPSNSFNCKKCGMPRMAYQHTYFKNDRMHEISEAEFLRARHQTNPEAKPFA